VCEVSPTCWEVQFIRLHTQCLHLKSQDVLQHRYVTLSSYCNTPFWTHNSKCSYRKHTVILSEFNGSSCRSVQFTGAAYRMFYLLIKPDILKCSLSLINALFKTLWFSFNLMFIPWIARLRIKTNTVHWVISIYLLICGSYMFRQICAIFRELPCPWELYESLGSCVVHKKYNVQEEYVRGYIM
jgi:hypothetical protein